MPSWKWYIPVVNTGYESTQEISQYIQSAPTIPLQYDTVPQSYTDEGLLYSYNVRMDPWLRMAVRSLSSFLLSFIDSPNALVLTFVHLTG